MTNVVSFPKPKAKRAPMAFSLDAGKLKAVMPKASTVRGFLAWVWLAVRLPLFLVLYWLRLPVVFLCNLISVPALLAWLFTMYAFPDKTHMVWGFGFISLGAFALAWLYDIILMALSPQDMMMTL